ncbi:XdhC family protein [Streptomyces canus]|uniref:XdhC family protein n=1 Tax=Streptomyces canus TaxID=58343 RepID=UPI0036A9271D
MLNIAETLNRWCREARPSALATVVDVRGSAPVPTGTSVAVDAESYAVGTWGWSRTAGGCWRSCSVCAPPGWTGP